MMRRVALIGMLMPAVGSVFRPVSSEAAPSGPDQPGTESDDQSAFEAMIANQPAAVAVISKLPDRLKAEYDKNRQAFVGSYTEMRDDSVRMVGSLQQTWVDLVKLVTPGGRIFSPGGTMFPTDWIDRYVDQQRNFYTTLEWHPGNLLVPIEMNAEADVMDDLLVLIERTVATVGLYADHEAPEDWKRRWEAAAEP